MCDILCFYSKSKDVYPGNGVREKVNVTGNYMSLSEIPDWRKILSNFYPCNLNDGNMTWTSVEHWYQGYKMECMKSIDINVINSDFAELSAQDVKSLTSKKNLSGDISKWDKIKLNVLKSALVSKFSNPKLLKILQLTNHAELQHISRGCVGDAFGLGSMLMELR